MAFAIIRAEKLKTIGNISASAQHTFRERPTPNADPQRTPLNEHFGAISSTQVIDKIKARLPAKRRSDAVLAIEYFVGASPEWFTGKNKSEIAEYFNRARALLEKRHGAENIVYFGTQFDESTPHAVAYVVPIADGKLNCKSFLGGREKLRGLQNDWAAAVADLGLERGIEGSKTHHEDVQRHWGLVERAKAPAPVLDPPTRVEALQMATNGRFPARVDMVVADLAVRAAENITLAAQKRALDLERRRRAGKELIVDRKVTAVVDERIRAAIATDRETIRAAYQKRTAERDEALAKAAAAAVARDQALAIAAQREVDIVVRDIELAALKKQKTLRLPVQVERWATDALQIIVRTAKHFGVSLAAGEKLLERLREARSVVDREDVDQGDEIPR